MPQVSAFRAASRPPMTPAKVLLLVGPEVVHEKKQGEDVDPASEICTEGGAGRRPRREGPAHRLRRLWRKTVGARVVCACQMSRESMNGVQSRGTEESGRSESVGSPAEERAWSLKVTRKGLLRPADLGEGEAHRKAKGVEASLTRRRRNTVGKCLMVLGNACARRQLAVDTGW